MGIILVSKVFANSLTLVSAEKTQPLGVQLDELALFHLYKMRKFAQTRLKPDDAYIIIFTTAKGSERFPLKHFIPAPVTQHTDGVEIEVLVDLEGDRDLSWELKAMNDAAQHLGCEIHEALTAVMNAIIHAAHIGAHIEFGQ